MREEREQEHYFFSTRKEQKVAWMVLSYSLVVAIFGWANGLYTISTVLQLNPKKIFIQSMKQIQMISENPLATYFRGEIPNVHLWWARSKRKLNRCWRDLSRWGGINDSPLNTSCRQLCSVKRRKLSKRKKADWSKGWKKWMRTT